MRVSCRCFHLEDAILNGQQGHVESSSTHVINEHIALTSALLVQPVRNRCGSRLIDDPQHIQPANLSSVFRGLALRIVEISRHSDNGVIHLCSQISLCSLFHLSQNHRGNLFWVEGFYVTLAIHLNHWFVARPTLYCEWPKLDVCLNDWIIEFTTNQALRIEHSVFRISCHLVFCCIPDQAFGVCECDIRGRSAVTLVIRNDFNTIIFPNSNTRVSRPQVNTHGSFLRHDAKKPCNKLER